MTAARDGHLPSLGWSPTNSRMVTHQKEVHYRLGIWHIDLRPGDNCQEWSPTIPRMVTPQPKDGHSLTGSIIQTRNLALRLNSQDKDQVTTARNGHLSSRVWSPTNLRMVTHQKEVYYRLGIWHLDLTHKTMTRWQLPWMVTYHPLDGHPPSKIWSPTFQNMVTIQKLVTHQAKEGHPPSPVWSLTVPSLLSHTIPRMITHQSQVWLSLLPAQSPIISRRVN